MYQMYVEWCFLLVMVHAPKGSNPKTSGTEPSDLSYSILYCVLETKTNINDGIN